MSVDKLVDSTQLDADLTTVANAIRAKGGTTAQLSFPTGMAAAVAALTPQPTLQSKTLTPTSSQQTATPDSGYDGLSSCTVDAVPTESPATITANGTYTATAGKWWTGATVNVTPTLQTKTATYTANGSYSITASSGYDGISSATVTVAIPAYDGSVS